MRQMLLLSLLATACAHRDNILAEFPQYDSGWWLEKNRCPDGGHRATIEDTDGYTMWQCQLDDGTPHGPYVWTRPYEGPVFAGFYDHGVRQEMYFDTGAHGEISSYIGSDGRVNTFIGGERFAISEHSLGCPDGYLESFHDNGTLAFRSRYDNGREIGPRIPYINGEAQPAMCIIGAASYCPKGITQWAKPYAQADECRKFKRNDYERQQIMRSTAKQPRER